MKGRVVATGTWRGRPAAAELVDGRLEDLIVDPEPGAAPRPGTIFRAIAGRPLKGLGGVFVDLPGGRSGYLRQIRGVAPGRPLTVQVSSFAEPGKAPPVTTRIALKGRHAILTPGAPGVNVSRRIRAAEERARLEAIAAEAMAGCPHGLILRSRADGAADAAIAAEVRRLRETADAVEAGADGSAPSVLLDGPGAADLAARDWAAPDIRDDAPGAFDRHGVEEAVRAALAPEQRLAGGATAWIEPTRALVAVDVNTGGDASPAAGLKANIALARALPRLLRCRGLGGQITVDAAPMPKKDRGAFESALRASFQGDPVETSAAGWTPLGHFELQRHRARWPVPS